MSQPLRVVVADDNRETREFLLEALPRLGCSVAAAENGRQLVELCRATQPDLVITDVKMPDMDGIEAAELIARDRPVPVILVSAYHDVDLLERAMTDHIMTYLVKPIGEAQLKSAIPLALHNFTQLRALVEEAGGLRQALEDRKVIERAKGVLMRRLRVDEAEAFRRLRTQASSQNQKLVEVGRRILASDEIFALLDLV